VRPRALLVLVFVLVAESMSSAVMRAWSAPEHRQITAAALRLLDPSVMGISERESEVVARSSIQPDLMRPRQMPLLRELEAPRHYIDLELLQGRTLPESVSEYLKLIFQLAEQSQGLLRPDWQLETVGMLPYAVVESTQRLAAIFAQLRRQPTEPNLRALALYQAGILAHYAQDLCQPLHTTLHYDGRARADGSSPGSGIHRQVDGLLRTVEPGLIVGVSQGFDSLFAAVIRELMQSHSQVDRVYELAGDLQRLQEQQVPSAALAEFGVQRYERAVRFTANLLHAAWLESDKIEIPQWSRP
jgi:hypothetical protein